MQVSLRRALAEAEAVATREPSTGSSTGKPNASGRKFPMSSGILRNVDDLPRSKAFGIEIRASSALAAPVSMLDGSFLEEPLRVRHSLVGDLAARQEALSTTLRRAVEHFKWKGVVGCSVTKEVCRLLEVSGDDFRTLEVGVGEIISRILRGRVLFCHTAVHTAAAGYNELVWGDNAEEANWRGKVVLACTLGKHLGAVIFSNGRCVRNSPLPLKTIQLPSQSADDRFEPPVVESPEFAAWANLVDESLCELLQDVSTVDRVIALPTGRIARATELAQALVPRLVRTREVVLRKECELTVPVQHEGAVVRGAALCGLVEFQTAQITKSLRTVISGEEALETLSQPQLRLIFDKLELRCQGGVELCELQEGLEVLGIHRDIDTLLSEIGSTRDGVVPFSRFLEWWDREFRTAGIVRITSANAWRQLITGAPPAGYGSIVLLQVTFTFCRSCKRFEPKLKRLSEQFPQVRFVQLVGNGTIGAVDLTTKEWGVTVSPAFFVFRYGGQGGELVAQWHGTNTELFNAKLSECVAAEKVVA